MAINWQTVRVFISSTFRDMQAERDHLVRFVFPKLRQELLQRRIHLVDVDLRWGVTSEQDALSVCREVVDECRPRFLCMLGGRYGWVPPGRTRSITADEVHYGVLDRDLRNRGFAYFYFRDPSATAAMVEVAPGEFREPAGSHGAVALADFKTAIIKTGLQPFVYRAQWDDQSRRLIGLADFGDRVYADLKQSIDQEFGPTTGEKPDEFTEENAAMEAFIEERVQRFVLGSRQPVWNELLQHAESTGGNGYLCLTGAAGSGKSALLAHFYRTLTSSPQRGAETAKTLAPFVPFCGQPAVVVCHFVGASPGSTDVRRTLRRLCHELVTGAGLTAEIPEDPEKLRVAFAEILQQASAQKRVVILLDAINQFDPTTQLAGWSWLPEELPATARIVLSVISEQSSVNSDQSSVNSDQSSVNSPVLAALRHRRIPPREIGLAPLTAEDAEAIIREFLHRYRKTMTDDQRAALLAKTDAGTPLYLLVALEELRTLGTYEEINDRIAQLSPDTRALFIWILKRLEDDDGFRDASGRKIGQELVSRFVSLLGASRHGLSQHELVELLSPGDPQGNVAALAQLLRPYLMQRGELLDFYHGQVREAVGQAYLEGNDKKLKVHTELAEYFHAQDYWCESVEAQRQRAKRLPPTQRPANVRKVTELPWQRLSETHLSGQWDKVEELFTDLFFLEAKAEANLVFDLAVDFAQAVAALPSHRPKSRILRLLQEALRRDIHFIARHQATLFQCMWNLCWWYDSPEAGAHYEETGIQSASDGQRRPGLHELMQGWLSAKSHQCSGFLWIRSLRPPRDELGSGVEILFNNVRLSAMAPDGKCVATHSLGISPDPQQKLVGHMFAHREQDSTELSSRFQLWNTETGTLVDWYPQELTKGKLLAFCQRSHRIVILFSSGQVQVWDLKSRAKVYEFSIGTIGDLLITTNEDGGWVATLERPSHIRVWDSASGQETAGWLCSTHFVYDFAFSPDGSELATAEKDGVIVIWNVQSGQERVRLAGHRGDVRSVRFSTDGEQLVSAGEDGTVRIWVCTTGMQTHCLVGHKGIVFSAAFSRDSRLVVSGGADETVRVWDTGSGLELGHMNGHGRQVLNVAFLPDRRTLSFGFDHTIRTWRVGGPNPERRLHNPHCPDWISTCTFSPDGRLLATISMVVRAVCVWEVQSGGPLWLLQDPDGKIFQVQFSPDSNVVYTDSDKRTTWLAWDLASGEFTEVTTPLSKHVDSLESETACLLAARRGPYETSFYLKSTNEIVAWFPAEMYGSLSRNSSGSIWAGSASSHLYLLQLEGYMGTMKSDKR